MSEARLWRNVVALFREVEGTSWGSLLLGNVWPAYLFALPLGARIFGLVRAQPHSADSLNEQARLLQEVVTVVFLALVVILFAIRRRSITGQRAAWGPGLVALVGTFLLNAVAFLPVEDSASTTALLVSSALVTVGTLFTIWSLATLGRCFGLFPEARGLVMRGPYRLVRHPVYLGEILSALGLILAKPHAVVVGLFLLFAVLQYWRTLYEERALAGAFPADYPAYKRQVPRLLPGWRS